MGDLVMFDVVMVDVVIFNLLVCNVTTVKAILANHDIRRITEANEEVCGYSTSNIDH